LRRDKLTLTEMSTKDGLTISRAIEFELVVAITGQLSLPACGEDLSTAMLQEKEKILCSLTQTGKSYDDERNSFVIGLKLLLKRFWKLKNLIILKYRTGDHYSGPQLRGPRRLSGESLPGSNLAPPPEIF